MNFAVAASAEKNRGSRQKRIAGEILSGYSPGHVTRSRWPSAAQPKREDQNGAYENF